MGPDSYHRFRCALRYARTSGRVRVAFFVHAALYFFKHDSQRVPVPFFVNLCLRILGGFAPQSLQSFLRGRAPCPGLGNPMLRITLPTL